MLSYLLRSAKALGMYTKATTEIDLARELRSLQSDTRYADPRSLGSHGCKVFSQNDEDGIIREIFNRIGTTNKVFIEFGVGDGLENNTLALLFDDWGGLWIEGSQHFARKIKSGFQRTIRSGQLALTQSFITAENIDALISDALPCDEVDLLGVDLDGNDYHVLKAISRVFPRVIVMEYNPKFAPPIQYCMEYDRQHSWNGTDKFGASLKFLEVKLKARGYSLVGCSLSGVNAFFVRDDLVEDHFLPPFTAECHYEPARFWLSKLRSGHPASYATLESRHVAGQAVRTPAEQQSHLHVGQAESLGAR